MAAHPASPDGWHAQHEGIVGYIVAHHGSCADERIPPDGDPTHNGGIGANRGAPSYQRAGIEMVADDLRPICIP